MAIAADGKVVAKRHPVVQHDVAFGIIPGRDRYRGPVVDIAAGVGHQLVLVQTVRTTTGKEADLIVGINHNVVAQRHAVGDIDMHIRHATGDPRHGPDADIGFGRGTAPGIGTQTYLAPGVAQRYTVSQGHLVPRLHINIRLRASALQGATHFDHGLVVDEELGARIQGNAIAIAVVHPG